jgi:UDP-N-acetylmuramoyl-L-alanyl-D-glutamate--2,6-diaminopimelate ligase
MKLSQLLTDCQIRTTSGDLDTEILGLAYDSRDVSRGYLFIAIRGTRVDGNRYIPQAVARGAVAIVSAESRIEPLAIPWIKVEDERGVMATLAGNFYGHPTKRLHLVGVTGTNGKTTTTYLIESILKAAGRDAAVLGTIEHRGPGFEFAAQRTTPEAPDLERMFKQVVDAGWKDAVMEVSSHAIAMKRVAGLQFEIAAFTNLSQDHLDFHGDMESYFQAKRKLFEGVSGKRPRVLVLNADDARYGDLRSIDPARVISYGLRDAADIRPIRYQFGSDGMHATYKLLSAEIEIDSSLMGKPNLYNIGAALGIAVALGISSEAMTRGIRNLKNVPGRFEAVTAGQKFRVIVDYAHTDDALEKVLTSAREITSGKLIVVFGCGGDRDRSKRSAMGKVAAEGSDFIVVTSDNPRTEDPMAIIGEIEKGLKGAHYVVIPDRRAAIRTALTEAKPNDTVLIAGKGHETYQTIGTTSFPFDDRVVARELLDELVA